MSVWPHRHPDPSSFFSITAFTAVYPGAGLGPGAAGVEGADEEEVSLPEPLPSALAVVASESESDSVVMRESTSMAARPRRCSSS